MTLGFDKQLYILPFDHRITFQTKIVRLGGDAHAAQTAEISAAKQVVYDGFNATIAAGVLKDKAGILVDEQSCAAPFFTRGRRIYRCRRRFDSLHWEGNNDLSRTVQRIKALGRRVGVVINPATPAAVLEEILQDVDQVLVMTVNPGFGHQLFLHTTLLKIQRVRQMIDQIKPGCDLEVDGGHRCDDRSAGGCCRRQRSGGRIGVFWRQRSGTRRHDTAASSTAMSNRYKGSNICSSE
jgi:ribulose phosphate 3-epimerase family protein